MKLMGGPSSIGSFRPNLNQIRSLYSFGSMEVAWLLINWIWSSCGVGPLRVAKKGAALEFNQHSWNKEANLLFVESPIGVGFSYTNTSSDFADIDDRFVAEDTYNFLVGNPETNDYFDYKGLLEYAWSHSVISDQDYDKARRACNFKLKNWSTGCVDAMTTVFDRYKEIDIYNIYAPSCLLKNTSDGYFNRMDVQKALHINSRGLSDTVKWTVCNDSVFRSYSYTVFSVLPIYRKLIKGGLKIWMYSGDADGRVPVIGSRYCVEALELPLKTPWTSWYYKNQVGGRLVEYEGLTLVTVRGRSPCAPQQA
ncbi:UNVERIFIED_CONTAM: Serine carboxypeptidase-like 26 [Sesamum calycinum]|uniref:Serine carboxypeptidase-like 26 n=1 Tax=Sesamum calycinum TaxID=2727403 RepID=A0AAW2R837_9LAMI